MIDLSQSKTQTEVNEMAEEKKARGRKKMTEEEKATKKKEKADRIAQEAAEKAAQIEMVRKLAISHGLLADDGKIEEVKKELTEIKKRLDDLIASL